MSWSVQTDFPAEVPLKVKEDQIKDGETADAVLDELASKSKKRRARKAKTAAAATPAVDGGADTEPILPASPPHAYTQGDDDDVNAQMVHLPLRAWEAEHALRETAEEQAVLGFVVASLVWLGTGAYCFHYLRNAFF